MRHYIILLLFFFPAGSYAQNITGVWEGIMDDEFLQVNIEQKDSVLCGYTYDYLLANTNNHCRAIFSGSYDKDKMKWTITGESFLENVGGHTFMRITMQMGLTDDTLWVKAGPKNFMAKLLGVGIISTYLLKKSKYTDIHRWMRPCFPKEKKVKKAPPVVDTLIIVPQKSEAIPAPDSATISKLMTVRKQTTQSRLVINTNQINLKLYDNGVVDNDTISIFYNGKLLVSHQRLSEKAVELNIHLDEKVTIHEITLFAENLGGIPPNTALVVITAGDKRYELRSSASLEENAVLVFEYKSITN
ncbi:hypothetical protein [Ferruginibacter sp. HRS2-29]|uniref:hypothetical protein n=1 Tax=Ferruginibacter sp. HRS2-29 TaxID=2487334 RepID=UPI0020CE01CB|nr:hypothetical protein [Ferruginibacter sp. HRS2-29]MCP9750306.1 hypothetical protein [Ferruginibacter sp. HRS2-29]